MSRYKPGSRVAAVFETFEKEGAEAAIAKGVELRLAPSTFHAWVRAWMKEAGQEGRAPPSAPKQMQTKPRVWITWDPDRLAYLIAEGPECSLVRWADTGVETGISNDQILKRELTEKEKQRWKQREDTTPPKKIVV